ncbi:MAG: BamA/TamA family outer membrane protein [Bacteriovoracaceae bacterium]|jgi:outer membrane protein insertion porin family|nr:BamA/TamA family outer membrane protein [Bacteriovoracaceae bacterium]
MRFFFILVLTTLLLSLGASAAQTTAGEQFSIEGRLISELVFIDDEGKPIEDPALLYMTLSKVGQELNADALIIDMNTLVGKFPEYSEIEINVVPIEGETNLKIEFLFQKKREISLVRIILENTEENYEVRDLLQAQKGVIFKSTKLEADKETIQKEYIKKGYPDVEVNAEVLDQEGASTDVVINYHVKSVRGRQIVKEITFSGNTSIKPMKLKKVLKSKKGNIFKKRALDVNNFPEDLDRIKMAYSEIGFIDAVVSYKIEDINKDKGHIRLVFNIVENERYEIKSVTISGNEIFKTKKVLSTLDFKEGSYFNFKNARKGEQALREIYGAQGYVYANVNLRFNSQAGAVLLEIVEGRQYTIKSIEVSGNSYMKERTILDDVDILPGEIVNIVKIQKILRKMKSLGYYDEVFFDFEPTSAEETTGKVIIRVVEARGQYIQFGVGASAGGFMGNVSYQDPNAFGSGSFFSILASQETEITRLGLIFRDPHLFGSRFALDFEASYSHFFDITEKVFDLGEYTLTGFRTRLMITRKIKENLEIGLGTRVQFLNVEAVSEELASEIHDAEGRATVVGMISSIAYKTEEFDNNGEKIQDFTASLSLLPSYSDDGVYIKAVGHVLGTLDLYKDKKGRHHTLSGRITIGYASNNTPFFEKFYAGGMGTIRGHKENSVTPSGSVAGGNFLASANLTYSFPLVEDIVRGVVFIEAANVSSDITDFSNFKVVAGAGVRFNLKKTFLRTTVEAGVALPLLKAEGDQLKPFYFILGDYDPSYDL